MRDVDSMIEKLLQMETDIIGEDNSVTFTDEAKQLIHEIAEECVKAPAAAKIKDKAEEYGKGLSAEDVYVDMLFKIIEAPTTVHIHLSAMLLIPIIDQKLQSGETGFHYKPEGKE